MLKIRLARVGKKKRPTYRFVVSESGRDLYGKALEIIGHYNPFSKVCDIDKDRANYWIGKGAQLSPTVHNLFVDKNVITLEKVKASSGKKKKEEEKKEESAAALGQPAKEEVKPQETSSETVKEQAATESEPIKDSAKQDVKQQEESSESESKKEETQAS